MRREIQSSINFGRYFDYDCPILLEEREICAILAPSACQSVLMINPLHNLRLRIPTLMKIYFSSYVVSTALCNKIVEMLEGLKRLCI